MKTPEEFVEELHSPTPDDATLGKLTLHMVRCIAARDREVAEKVREACAKQMIDFGALHGAAEIRALDLEKVMGGDDELA
jgi:hypothetical protein